jgi:NADH:ubiquinone oxidoreductase subunit 6 (subunit J)
MFADSTISRCAFKFNSWSCAGYTSTWIASWLVGGLELIFFLMAMFDLSFRPTFYTLTTIWTYLGASFLLLPIVFWIIAISVENVPFDYTLKYNFLVGSVIMLVHLIMHLIFVPDIESWANEQGYKEKQPRKKYTKRLSEP